jgi:hypothetical protein
MRLLDRTAHEGSFANSGSWMKKRNLCLKQNGMNVHSEIKV